MFLKTLLLLLRSVPGGGGLCDTKKVTSTLTFGLSVGPTLVPKPPSSSHFCFSTFLSPDPSQYG